MKRYRINKIIFAVIIFLIAAGYYYSTSGRNNDDAKNITYNETEKTLDVVSEDKKKEQEKILDESDQAAVASGTYENDSVVDEKDPDSELPKLPKEQTPIIKSVLFDVPFTSQAPFGNWSDARKQDGCEEAAVIMAMAWVKGETLNAKSVDDEINRIAEYEKETVGTFHDTSAFDTAEIIFKGYFEYNDIEVRYRIGKEDIKKELFKGNLVLVPTNGQLLGNPNYTPPGPTTHYLVIIGYNDDRKEFITNDPGTRNGKSYRYDEDVLIDAVVDYPTGYHEKVDDIKTAMIIVLKN